MGSRDMAKFKSDLAMIDLYNSAWINNASNTEKPNANTIMSLYLKLKARHPNIASVIDDLVKEKNGDPRNPKKTFSVFDDYPLWKIGKGMMKKGRTYELPSPIGRGNMDGVLVNKSKTIDKRTVVL